MTLVAEKVKGAVGGVVVTPSSQGLAAFKRPDCAAAIWHRRPRPEFQAWIDGLQPENLPNGRVILHRGAFRAALTELCDIARTPLCPEREQLINDATAQSEVFADLMETQYLRLRLQAVTTNACRKFHIDAVTARLVCTYRGIGTQYGVSNDRSDPERIFTVPTGAPVLLRGTLWPATPARGLRHRSPPIEGTGETRLVLVIDPITDPEDA